jgi:hypothetical protein
MEHLSRLVFRLAPAALLACLRRANCIRHAVIAVRRGRQPSRRNPRTERLFLDARGVGREGTCGCSPPPLTDGTRSCYHQGEGYEDFGRAPDSSSACCEPPRALRPRITRRSCHT